MRLKDNFHFQCSIALLTTDVLKIEDAQGLKREAPPLQTKPMGQNSAYFDESPLAGFN